MFVSGDKDQISWASQAWAVLAGVTEGDEAKVALRKAYEEGGVEGVTPYLHHYVSLASSVSKRGTEEGREEKDLTRRVFAFRRQQLVEAFIKAGLDDLAAKHIISYWG